MVLKYHTVFALYCELKVSVLKENRNSSQNRMQEYFSNTKANMKWTSTQYLHPSSGVAGEPCVSVEASC